MEEDDFDFGLETLRDDFGLLLDTNGPLDFEDDLPSPLSPLDKDITSLEESLENNKPFIIPNPQKKFNNPPPQQNKPQTNSFPFQGNQFNPFGKNQYMNINPFNQMKRPMNSNQPFGNMIPHYQKQSTQQFRHVSQVMNQPSNFTQTFQNMIPFSQPKHITLTEGFINPVKDRQPGGKDNVKNPLPKQAVELNRSGIPPNVDPTKLSCQALLIGFDRRTKQRCVLSKLSTRRFGFVNNRVVAVFDDLIVRFSSHLHGIKGKLFLKFNLLDYNNNIVDSIESQGFLTITKRGLEKQRERKKRKNESMGFNQVVKNCTPPIGLTNGNLLVKIHGDGFIVSPLFHSFVTFGVRKAREIISIRRNLIVCETPQNKAGMVNVNVSLDGRSYLNSTAKFLYVSQFDQNGIRQMMNYFINPQQFNNSGNQQNFNNNMNNNNNVGFNRNSNVNNQPLQQYSVNSNSNEILEHYEYFNFITGRTVDYRGQNLFHHAACRGYGELITVLYYYFKTQFINEQIFNLKQSMKMNNNNENENEEEEEFIEEESFVDYIEEDINNFEKLINLQDNFGRTPLMWACESGRFDTCRTLIEFGSDEEVVDEEKNNLFHIICQRGEKLFFEQNESFSEKEVMMDYVNEVKNFFFFMLKQDFKLENCKKMLKLFRSKNLYEKLPGDYVSEENFWMNKLFRNFEKFCEERLSRVEFSSIQVRSGGHNGKMVKLSNKKKNFFMKFEKLNIIINIDENMRVVVPNKELAFVILARNEKRLEFTLRKNPQVQMKVYTNKKEFHWKEIEKEEDHLMKSLSFFVNTNELELTRVFQKFVQEKSSELYQFKPWSFVYRSPKVLRKKKENKKYDDSTQHVLQQKILNFKRSQLKKGGIFLRRKQFAM